MEPHFNNAFTKTEGLRSAFLIKIPKIKFLKNYIQMHTHHTQYNEYHKIIEGFTRLYAGGNHDRGRDHRDTGDARSACL